ncbi:MAG: hypothetical protein IJR58_07390 [Lachnospiraceae bacterium]|nr:hypothetical protein [Lachnospiraceae bacterium]
MNFLTAVIFLVAVGVWLLPMMAAIHYQRIDEPYPAEQKEAQGLAYRDAFWTMIVTGGVIAFLNYYEILPKMTAGLMIMLVLLSGVAIFFSSALIRGGFDNAKQTEQFFSKKTTGMFYIGLYAFIIIMYAWMIIENLREGKYSGISIYGVFDVWEFLYPAVYIVIGIAALIRRSKERKALPASDS